MALTPSVAIQIIFAPSPLTGMLAVDVCVNARRRRPALKHLKVAMVNLALMVWAAAGFSGSCGGTTPNGRCVMAHSDTWYVECEFEGETAKITTLDNLVVVSPTSIDVDGHVLIPIAPTTPSVDVVVRGGLVTVIADGLVLADCRTRFDAPAYASPSGFVTALDELNAAACAVIGRYSERSAELEKLCERYEDRIEELENLAADRSSRSMRN